MWGERYGAGRPWALALHGWGRDHHDFAGVLGGTSAIALDLPGFGVTPEPPGPWSSSEYARALAAVLDECFGEGPVVLVGHSFGARVAVRLSEDPRVAALVLAGAPLALPPGRRERRPALVYRAARALSSAGLVSKGRMEALRHRYGSEDYRAASPTMRAVLVKAVAETASGAYIPALAAFLERGGALELVFGELDQAASLEGLRAWLAQRADLAGRARTTVVPGAGHLISPSVAEAVREALCRLGGAGVRGPS